MAEVQASLDLTTVRTIALQATGSLRLHNPVERNGGAVTVPVSDKVLGRLMPVVGETGDRIGTLPKDTPRWPIYRMPRRCPRNPGHRTCS